jgi:poly(hydroxyalkanoate) depolymerase family esterase
VQHYISGAGQPPKEPDGMAGLKDTIATLSRLRTVPPNGLFTPDAGVLTTHNAFGKNPGNLTMRTYRPAGLAPGRLLIVVLHGCTQSAESYTVEAGWVQLADRYGFGLLCPEQVMANNANRCFNWFDPGDVQRGRGEVASIRAMIAKAISLMSSEPSQVYVTGLSAGGAMAAALLATYPEVFAGGGIIAGLPYGVAKDMPSAFMAMQQGSHASSPELGQQVRAASSHVGPWPRVSVWHGSADATVRASNADASVSQWLDVNAMTGEADQIDVDGPERRDQWIRDGVVVVERRLIAGLGHGTPIASTGPDGIGRPGPFVLEVGLSSSLELLRFWGVTTDRHRAHLPSAHAERAIDPAPRPRPRAVPAMAAAGHSDELGISAIINKALRSAGLMK